MKIQSSILNNVRVGTVSSVSIDFKIESALDLSALKPGLTDYSSNGVSRFIVNMGQYAFIGDPLGYQPYDPSYDTANFEGEYTVETGDVLVPNNLKTITYNLQRTTGKYYYEVTIENDGWYGCVGLSPTFGTNSIMVSSGVGVAGIGDARTYLSYFSDTRAGAYNTNEDSSYQYSQYDVVTSDVLQVFIDYDTDSITIKKLGSSKADHINYIANN